MSATSTDTYDQVNSIREDLSDIIHNVSPEEVPFYSSCSKKSVANTYFEWLKDNLEDVSTDVAIEGADASFSPASQPDRLGNYTEIITKTAIISGTLEATNRAGRQREMAYQTLKRMRELRCDVEHHLVGISNAYAAGSAGAARETASYDTWCVTNTSAVGADPTGDGSDAPADGTQRAFTEALLEDVIDSCFINGGNPDIIMAAPFNKRKLNTFAGNTQGGGSAGNVQQDSSAKRVINAVSIYESDYGSMKVVPNRFLRPRNVLVYESKYWKIGELRPARSMEIARTGDAEKRQIVYEYGLEACNEESSGIIRDLTVS
jgi:hypothetical protein